METNSSGSAVAPKAKRRACRGELAALKDGPLTVLRERATVLGFRCLSDSWADYRPVQIRVRNFAEDIC